MELWKKVQSVKIAAASRHVSRMIDQSGSWPPRPAPLRPVGVSSRETPIPESPNPRIPSTDSRFPYRDHSCRHCVADVAVAATNVAAVPPHLKKTIVNPKILYS